jgi:hypothetical protein
VRQRGEQRRGIAPARGVPASRCLRSRSTHDHEAQQPDVEVGQRQPQHALTEVEGVHLGERLEPGQHVGHQQLVDAGGGLGGVGWGGVGGAVSQGR